MKNKYSLLIISVLLILTVFCSFLSLPVNAATEVQNNELSNSQAVYEFVYNMPEDNSDSISDNESKLLSNYNNRSNPSSIDLSASSYFPPVRSQHNIGNCASWAGVYYQFGFQVANEYSLNVNSTYNQFSPKWVHNLVVNNTDNSGAPITAVYEVLISNGAVRYSQFPPTSVRVADPSTEFLPWYLNTNSMETAL